MESPKSTGPKTDTQPPKARVRVVDGVNVYARPKGSSAHCEFDAIDQDEAKIRDIADILFRRGFGVMRQRSARAGKVFYLLKATWAGPGEAPLDPFDQS